eukprot:3089360-Pyramimonas_sp.AAC.2
MLRAIVRMLRAVVWMLRAIVRMYASRVSTPVTTTHQNIPVAGTSRRRGERIYPYRAPIAEGAREYTRIGNQSQKG